MCIYYCTMLGQNHQSTDLCRRRWGISTLVIQFVFFLGFVSAGLCHHVIERSNCLPPLHIYREQDTSFQVARNLDGERLVRGISVLYCLLVPKRPDYFTADTLLNYLCDMYHHMLHLSKMFYQSWMT